MPTPTECDTEIRVRYAECDPMGYLHHSQYLVYFEQGRTELLRQQGYNYADMEKTGKFFAVARLEVKFRKPAHYDDLLTLTTRIDRATRARIDHVYELKNSGVLLCTARSTLACVDTTGQLIPIPSHFFES